MARLDGKIALITGAARGQGAAIARRFASEGARVVLGDVLDEEGKIVAEEIGASARYVHHDVSDPTSWDEAARTAVEAFGSVNVLINNAGIVRWAPIHKHSLDDFMAVVNVNQVGCFLGIKAVIPAMREAGGGSIVNTASDAGLEGMAGIVGYCASKFAIRGMTRTAAIELGRWGIRVNAVCPGGINTVMANPFEQPEEEQQKAFARNPIPRIGTPEEIASLMVFLASDESSYCTGGDFVIDGGYIAGRNPLHT